MRGLLAFLDLSDLDKSPVCMQYTQSHTGLGLFSQKLFNSELFSGKTSTWSQKTSAYLNSRTVSRTTALIHSPQGWSFLHLQKFSRPKNCTNFTSELHFNFTNKLNSWKFNPWNTKLALVCFVFNFVNHSTGSQSWKFWAKFRESFGPRKFLAILYGTI